MARAGTHAKALLRSQVLWDFVYLSGGIGIRIFPLRCPYPAAGGFIYSGNLRTATTAFKPPKPKELLRAALMGMGRATLGT